MRDCGGHGGARLEGGLAESGAVGALLEFGAVLCAKGSGQPGRVGFGGVEPWAPALVSAPQVPS